jgi:GDP-L-fucose synthase
MKEKNAHDIRHSAGDFINIGSGQELSIKAPAETVRSVVYEQELLNSKQSPDTVCRITWDTAKPKGTLRKRCDISRLSALGFTAKTALRDGIKKAYMDFHYHRNQFFIP